MNKDSNHYEGNDYPNDQNVNMNNNLKQQTVNEYNLNNIINMNNNGHNGNLNNINNNNINNNINRDWSTNDLGNENIDPIWAQQNQ